MNNGLPPICNTILQNFRQTHSLGEGVARSPMSARDARELTANLNAEMDMVCTNPGREFHAVDEESGTMTDALAQGNKRSGQMVEVHQNKTTEIVVDTVFRPDGIDSLMLVVDADGYKATATHIGRGKGARSSVQICGESWNLAG